MVLGKYFIVTLLKTISADIILQALWKLSADGFILTNQDFEILDINDATVKLLGYGRQEILSQNLTNYMVLQDLKETDDKLSNDEAQQLVTPVIRTFFNNKGSDLPLLSSIYSILDDNAKIIAYLVIAYVVQTNSVQQAQTEFVSTVSHELRTPLTSIKGFADTILRAQSRLDGAQLRRYVGIIKDQADRLTRLVEDLLAVSRLESKKMQLAIRACDLSEAVRRVCQNLAVKALNHNIVITIPSHVPPVFADSDRLEQILTNLIDNAIKYSPTKTMVTISACEIKDKNDPKRNMVQFMVSDQGVGIAEKHLPQIFTKFSRLDNPLIRQTEGTGLGLYITRSLILSLGGHIYVNSCEGNTTFTVELPAASLEEQAARGRDYSHDVP